MTSTLYAAPRAREFTASGAVQSGAKLYFYVANTTTPATTYTSRAMSQPNPNPVVADTGGLFPAIWLDDAVVYDVTCKSADEVTQWTAVNIGAGTGNILALYSEQTAEPYANTYIVFIQPDGVAKGYIGFASELDNSFSVYTREDESIRFLTGTPGDPTSSIQRATIYGDADQSWLTIDANSATGCAELQFRRVNGTVKGKVGFTASGDNDLDIANIESGGHITFDTTGTGRIFIPLADGTAGAPMLAITGDATTGFYSSGASALNLSVGGTLRWLFAAAMTTVSNILKISSNGSAAAPSLVVGTNTGDDTGLYHQGSGFLGAAAGGVLAGTFCPNGSFRFPTAAGAPGTPVDGQVYYNTGTNKLQVRAGGAWVDLH